MAAQLKTIWQFYLNYLNQHPIKTKVIFTVVS